MENLFEKASRQKLRFETVRGVVSVEDLWEAPLTSKNGYSLDDIAKGINRELKDTKEESFVEPSSTGSTTLELKLEILKHIIKTRQEENEAKSKAQERRAIKQRLLEELEKRKDSKYEGMSEEDLRKELESLS